MTQISQRAQAIEPFYVMQVAQQAQALAAALPAGSPRMLYLNIGEPDATAPPQVQAAAEAAIRQGLTQYTPATGLPALREALSQWYRQRFGLEIPARRIVVTAGASAALQLACLAVVDAGQEVLMPDPSYPCNRHILRSMGARARLLPTHAQTRFQLSAEAIDAAWQADTAGVLMASPSNPTGTSLDPHTLAAIHRTVRARGGTLMLDEIYLGLSFDERYGQTGLALGDDVISINSFSKYFAMTGWRLGWLVVPEALVGPVERLAQNLYICASTVAQHAALGCFAPDSLALCEQRRLAYRDRRDGFVPALQALGLEVPVMPDGAFYVWADASPTFAALGVSDSAGWVDALMRQAHVVVTPSRDFSDPDNGRFVRFSTACAAPDLQEALQRLGAWLQPRRIGSP
jgi:aspartate/methionine/tyrosine aminotransferase